MKPSGTMRYHLLFPAVSVILFPLSAVAQSLTAEYCGIKIVMQSYGDGSDAIRPFQEFDDGTDLKTVQVPFSATVAASATK